MPEIFEIKNGVLKKYHGMDTSVIIPDSVSEIGKGAFTNCRNLTSVTIPDSVTKIGFLAFGNCISLSSVDIPDSVTYISDGAFGNCISLTSVVLPETVTEIGDTAFLQCPRLTIYCHYKSYAYYFCLDHQLNCMFNSVEYEETDEGIVIKGYTGIEKNLKIKSEYDGIPVIKIADNAFKKCSSLCEIIIPDGVREIGISAFEGCPGLKKITIPDTVSLIGKGAFSQCGSLTSVVIPDSITEIGGNLFKGCKNLSAITLPDNLRIIGSHAFLDCVNLTSAVIPDKVEIIGDYAFSGCRSLTSIDIPDAVREIGQGAFSGCGGLTSISIPAGVTEIKDCMFVNCPKLMEISVPDSVSKIGDKAFFRCSSLTSFTIPAGVTKIEPETFSDCSNLTSVNIPESVMKIGYEAFSECRNLTSVTLPENVMEIQKSAFSICTSLTSVNIPDSVKIISEKAFLFCQSLTSISIPDGVTEIGTGAFSYCGELRSIVIPESVTKIADDAFSDCPKLTFICHEGSCTHQFCQENHFTFIFDYQYEAFHGLLPPGIEKLASPFLADEEKPYIFISYSHKDRDAVLGIIKTLYESGWKVWYDEGLTIGDRYDETLENHVKNCAAFLLFVTEHSIGSFYVRENEIPWAIDSGKPIIKCILDEGTDYEIREDSVAATVSPAEIEPALEKIRGLVKGERRTAKGISVVVNPGDREDSDGGGYAFCLYSAESSASAQTILLEARNSGCAIYDAGKEGIDESLLQNSACLVVFLDKAFLSEGYLTEMLIKEYQSAKDIAVCQLEDIEDDDLPQELLGLHMMQWLNFVHGITGDMNTKLARHLQKRGCRNSAILPGFEYEETDKGIVIRRYTGIDPSPRIESEYGGRPVLEIADKAFENGYNAVNAKH